MNRSTNPFFCSHPGSLIIEYPYTIGGYWRLITSPPSELPAPKLFLVPMFLSLMASTPRAVDFYNNRTFLPRHEFYVRKSDQKED